MNRKEHNWTYNGSGLIVVLLGLLLALMAPCTHAQEVDSPAFGPGDSGRIADRDNTRLQGTVFDPSGNPMTDVHIWVTNDQAPANRVRSKTRKNGNYLVRSMADIYTEQDPYGVLARIRFEKAGHQTVEARVHIDKNGIERVYPILGEEGETVAPEGICVMLSGRIQDSREKGVKGATVQVLQNGKILGEAGPTRGDGTFEILLWEVGPKIDVQVNHGGSSVTRPVQLEPSPQPDLFMAHEFLFTVD